MKFYFSFLLTFLAWHTSAQPIPHPSNGRPFEEAIVPRVYITLPADTLNWIFQNVQSDKEWHAEFVHMHYGLADTVQDVGFRLRGNTSRNSGKKSFKISFNSFQSGARWEGLKDLNLNSEHNDPSISRARIGWHLLSDLGLAASRVSPVRLYINGDFYGLYANVEHINDDYVERRYGGKAGNLYKCLYPAPLTYISSNPNDYKFVSGGRRAYDLKTNTTADDYSDLAQFISVLNQTSTADLPCALEAIFDVNEYLYTLAVEIAIGHWDNHANNQNNFYLYHSNTDGLMHYLAFDLDNTLGVDWFNQDWTSKNIHNWGATSNYPLYSRLSSIPEYALRLQLFLEEIHQRILSNDFMGRSIHFRDQQLNYIAEDVYYGNDYGYDSTDFHEAWHNAAGGHVKKGIQPFLAQRASYSQTQFISGNADPVLWRPRLLGASNQAPIHATVVVFDEAVPSSVLLQYRASGTTLWTSVDLYDDGLHGDGDAGDRTYGNQFSVSGIATTVDYRFAAQDTQGQLGTWPCTYSTHLLHPFPAVVINEAQSANQNTLNDQNGDDSDWLELYNLSNTSTSLLGLYLSDDPTDPDAYPFTGGSMAGNGHRLIWASGDTTLYADHAPFKLSSGGDWLGLYFKDSSGTFHLLDEVHIPALAPDYSYGRYTDGHPQWVVFAAHPTPNQPNAGSFSDVEIDGDAVHAYPNPFAEGIWIASSQNENTLDLVMTNATGQVVHRYQGPSPYYWSGMLPGMYWIQLLEGHGDVQHLPVIKMP
ncbi:MAG: CotH kinase family protein [Cryomorphaceae bacterium]